MSNTIKKCIAVLTLAGILMAPACSPIDGVSGNSNPKNEITASPNSSDPQTSDNNQPSGTDPNNPPQGTKEPVQVITSDEELEEYFDSISDEEIEELFDIIEGIDISSDINPDADPGFDEVEIP